MRPAGVIRLLGAFGVLAGAPRVRAFLGVADTSLVTVVADPAEAANWAAQLQRLASELEAAQATLQTVEAMRAYAGDPRAALLSLPDLAPVLEAAGALASGSQSEADLLQQWQAEGAADRLMAVAALLTSSGAGASMDVYGQATPRDPSLYAALAAQAQAAAVLRSQVAGEQRARQGVSGQLALAWSAFRGQTSESGKQAVLTEISQLQAEDQVMGSRRQAMMDDLALSDRTDRISRAAADRAADEPLLAQSAQLSAAAATRAAAADAQRASTLAKPVPARSPSDYAGLRTWTTADAGGSP